MFVAIYRWRLHGELERDFVDNWQRITQLGLAAGSGGSSLFKDQEGSWVAIARWPSREAREQFFQQMAGDDTQLDRRERAALAIIERFSPQELESVLDCWSPFSASNQAAAS